jgi:hypothetical protein
LIKVASANINQITRAKAPCGHDATSQVAYLMTMPLYESNRAILAPDMNALQLSP